MIKNTKFCKQVDFYPGIVRPAGTASFTQGNTSFTFSNAAFENDVSDGDSLYTPDFKFIGIVDVLSPPTNGGLFTASPITYSGPVLVNDGTKWAFEGSDIRVGFTERRNSFTLIDGTIIQDVEWYRFILRLGSPYLRGDGEFVDVLNEDTIHVHVPDYESDGYEVVRSDSGIEIGTQRQRVIPTIGYGFQAVDVVQEIPDWFKFTKDKQL